jgi:hypothetical protein
MLDILNRLVQVTLVFARGEMIIFIPLGQAEPIPSDFCTCRCMQLLLDELYTVTSYGRLA